MKLWLVRGVELGGLRSHRGKRYWLLSGVVSKTERALSHGLVLYVPIFFRSNVGYNGIEHHESYSLTATDHGKDW